MGIPLMIQEKDNEKIEQLKKDLKISKKIDVVRMALALLDAQVVHEKRMKQWRKAAKIITEQGDEMEVNKEFQKYSQLHKVVWKGKITNK